jgi:hypothetical protein
VAKGLVADWLLKGLPYGLNGLLIPFGAKGLPFAKGLAVDSASKGLALRLPRYSGMDREGGENKETSKQEFPTAPPVYSAAYSSMKKHGKRVRNDVEDVPL